MLEELAAEEGQAAGVACGSACDAGGGQASAGDADYALFDCI
jgi:hypothetical protein